MTRALQLAYDYINMVELGYTVEYSEHIRMRRAALNALRAELAKPEQLAQEPATAVSLQCANCQVTIDQLNDKVMYLMAQPAQEPLSNDFLEILEAVRRELDDGDKSGNAPGHVHDVPGIWDSDNYKKAGKPCSWCAAWKKFTELIDSEKARGIGGKA